MKRIRLLILISILAVALPVGILSGVAKATGTTGTRTSLTINQNAQFDLVGSIIHVGLRASCPPLGTDPITNQPIPGSIHVHVVQDPPETAMHAEADAVVKQVVCDGQVHSVGVSLLGEGFDAGRANATAEFVYPVGGATAQKWIDIIVMPS
jgi:hypothetical protein